MDRRDDAKRFYDLLGALASRTGGPRRMSECSGQMSWPERGVYFFLEPDEVIADGQNSIARVTRVGTHALAKGSRSTLWQRLRAHRGSLNPLGGSHRASVFRKLVGRAILEREPQLHVPSWEGVRLVDALTRTQEQAHEAKVSEYIGAMSLIFLPVSDEPGPQSLRGFLERNSIALLSNLNSVEQTAPGAGWLGRSSPCNEVVGSGLWNIDHVRGQYDPKFLDEFERCIDEMDWP